MNKKMTGEEFKIWHKKLSQKYGLGERVIQYVRSFFYGTDKYTSIENFDQAVWNCAADMMKINKDKATRLVEPLALSKLQLIDLISPRVEDSANAESRLGRIHIKIENFLGCLENMGLYKNIETICRKRNHELLANIIKEKPEVENE